MTKLNKKRLKIILARLADCQSEVTDVAETINRLHADEVASSDQIPKSLFNRRQQADGNNQTLSFSVGKLLAMSEEIKGQHTFLSKIK